MTRTRAIATMLALLHPADRRWLLARLGKPAQEKVTGELKALLRLPRSRRMMPTARGPELPVAVAPAAAPDAALLPGSEAALIARIDSMADERLVALWKGAPDWLLRNFLDIHPWRSSSKLQGFLPVAKLALVHEPIAPSARQALLQAVWDALQLATPARARQAA